MDINNSSKAVNDKTGSHNKRLQSFVNCLDNMSPGGGNSKSSDNCFSEICVGEQSLACNIEDPYVPKTASIKPSQKVCHVCNKSFKNAMMLRMHMKLHPGAKQNISSNQDAVSLTEQQKCQGVHQANKKCRTHIGAVSKQFKSEINLKPEPVLDIFAKSSSSQGEGLVKLSIPSEGKNSFFPDDDKMSFQKSEGQDLELVKLQISKPSFKEHVGFEKELLEHDFTNKCYASNCFNSKPVELKPSKSDDACSDIDSEKDFLGCIVNSMRIESVQKPKRSVASLNEVIERTKNNSPFRDFIGSSGIDNFFTLQEDCKELPSSRLSPLDDQNYNTM